MERICEQCGARIPPQKGSARPRKFCTVCRPPRNRPNPRVISLDLPQPERSSLVESYRRRLDEAGRLDTPEGAHVVMLAGLLTAGQHTASGAAALSRELRSAMEDALKGAARSADALDELAKRRDLKASGA